MNFTTVKVNVLAFLKLMIVMFNGLAITRRFKKLKKVYRILIGLAVLSLGGWYFAQKTQGPMMPPPPGVIV